MQSVQARELAEMTSKGKELRARIKELTEALEKEQSATSLATKELQVRTFPPPCILELIIAAENRIEYCPWHLI